MSDKNKFDHVNSPPAMPAEQAQAKPTIEKGNYLIQVISEGREIRQVVVIGAEINIIKLAEGGLAIDLK